MSGSKYRPLTTILMSELLAQRCTQTHLRRFFAEFDKPVDTLLASTTLVDLFDSSKASSKREQVREVLDYLRTKGYDGYLEMVFAEALKAMDEHFVKEFGKKAVTALNHDGFPWERLADKRALIEGFELPEKISYVKAALMENNYEIALFHLQEALSSYELGNYSAANGQIRTFLEALFEEIVNNKLKIKCKGGDCKKIFAKKYFTLEESQAAKAFSALLHTKGSHPGKSEKHETEFRLFSASCWAIYALEVSR